MTEAEAAARARLGIPADARQVLVFAESSHWDTNWLKTSDDYYAQHVEPILLTVLATLEADPARVYSVESVFFLRLFWERRPRDRERLRALMTAGRLKLLSASLTTPDTLLPHPESVLRDYLLGDAWLESVGLPGAPRTSYFPDNFGHSPHLPTLMREVGVDAAAITRIDGMYFIAADYRPRADFPLPGSSAHALTHQHRSLDFVWRDDAGAELLCHWNAFTYFQGDMLAHAGIIRWAGTTAAVPMRTRGHIARRIDGYVRALAPLARTPYLFCPIGMDFNAPIDDLRALLERDNRERFGATGVWSVLAGHDDYFGLLQFHRAALPVLALDPNPYWMGFYASRPEVKQRAVKNARALLAAERAEALGPGDEALRTRLRAGWERLVPVNHHDCITGTSPDAVWSTEQRAWLECEFVEPPLAPPPPGIGLRVRREGLLVHVETPQLRFTLSESVGGCLTSLTAGGDELLRGPGFDLHALRDEGGLWRLGHEFRGGAFEMVDRASTRPATVSTAEVDGALRCTIHSQLDGREVIRTLTCRAGEAGLALEVEGAVGRRRTVTAHLGLAAPPASLRMDTLGGTITRPRERLFHPTFWPVPSWLELGARSQLHFEAPTAVSGSAAGVEWIVQRNAVKERAFGLLPVLAHPIGGTDDGVQRHRAVWWLQDPEAVPTLDALRCEGAMVAVQAVKRAQDGRGLIVRLAARDPGTNVVRLWLEGRPLRAAQRCDALERDLGPLTVEAGAAAVPLQGRLATVRLELSVTT